MKFFAIFTLSLLSVFQACKITQVETTEVKPMPAETILTEQKETKQHREVPDWAKNAIMYEVNVRQYSEEGTFKALQNDLPRLKALGVDILWLMPIHPIGEKERKGALGSYYAVKDYKAVNPKFGTMQDFKNLVTATHKEGMYLIIDWVDLNYDNRDMREAMIEAMEFWVIENNIDGFRCDVAHSVPVNFWNDVKTALDKIKPLFMLAEAEKPVLHQNGFHASYAWNLHHSLNKVANGKMNANDIRDYLIEDAIKHQPKDYRLNFTSNHDENSWNGTVFERMGEAHKCLAALTYIIPGMPLIYNGQEAPLKKRLAFFEKDAIDWNNYTYADFYKTLNQIKKRNTALWNGEAGGTLQIISTTNSDQVLAIRRNKEEANFVAIFNLSDTAVSVEIKDAAFTQKTSKTHIRLDAWSYEFFE